MPLFAFSCVKSARQLFLHRRNCRMNTISNASVFCFSRRIKLILLALFICIGAAFGVYTAQLGSHLFFPLMRMAVNSRVSIFRLSFAVLLPFLLSAVAVLISSPLMLSLICCVKTSFFTLCVYSVCSVFYPAGWLICFLFLFSDAVAEILLQIYCIRNVDHFGIAAGRELLVISLCALFAVFLDMLLIMPFLHKLINY